MTSNKQGMNKLINPQMMVVARESRGLTQMELAKLSGLSQAEVSRFENEQRPTSDEHLEVIAETLNYPPSFFYRTERRYGLGSSGLHHRKRKSLPTKTLSMFIAKVNILRLIVSKLLEGVEIEHVQKFPQWEVDEFKGDIEQIAELVRATWKLPSGPVVDLVGVIENAGGIVHRIDFGTQKIDALVQWVPPAPPIFLINESFPGDRLRFTLAHEIGHLVMHDMPHENMEEQADAFASAFLMPAADILPDLEKVTLPHLAQLKPYWKVSIAALIRRARDLDCVSDRQYRTLYEEMSKLGYRIQEPISISVEKPTLLKEIIDAYFKELKYSVSELANLVDLSEEDLRAEFLPQKHHLRIVPSHNTH